MREETLIKIRLDDKTNLLSVESECPECEDKYMQSSPHAIVHCGKCGAKYKTDFKQDIYTKKARQMEDKKVEGDGIIIEATEQYKPQLIHMMYNHIEQKCWDVSEIIKSGEEYRRCLNCGICRDCYICKECKTSFERNKSRRKQECPKCGKSNYSKTYFEKAKIKNHNKRICPNCNSENIRLTRTTNKSKCYMCGSTNLSAIKVDNIFTVTVKRKKAYRK